MPKMLFNEIIIIVGMVKEKQIYDVLIIGAGGSGLAASIFCRNQGLKVAVMSKVHPLQSHTVAAQGGINAALGNISTDDPKWHIFDTIKASDMLADQDSVRDMCEGAVDAIKLLEELGVEFDRTQDGRIDQKIYGGQTTDFGQGSFAHRACYSKDKTGHTIMHSLYSKALELEIDFYNYHFALDVLIDEGKTVSSIKGISCLDIETGHFKNILSRNVILATGGYSQIYDTATSAALCTGDGVGIVARAGLSMQDMEFIQFHPTALSKIGVLITEASRSAGGRLYNGSGQRFMEKYAPKFKELSPRDVVSKAIFTEILEGRGAGDDKDHVLLDLTFMSQDEIKKQLPTVYENCSNFLNIDPSRDLIPVKPAAHYTMGGVATDAKCRVISALRIGNGEPTRSSDSKGDSDPTGSGDSKGSSDPTGSNVNNDAREYIQGLYAIGEAACISVHGAGRLGCNSLLDLVVFAKIAALDIANTQPTQERKSLKEKCIKYRYVTDGLIDDGLIDDGFINDQPSNDNSKNIQFFSKSLLQMINRIENSKQRKYNDKYSDLDTKLRDKYNKDISDRDIYDPDSLLALFETKIDNLLSELRNIMSFYAGVFRSKDLLEKGLGKLEKVKNTYNNLEISNILILSEMGEMGKIDDLDNDHEYPDISSLPWNTNLVQYLELGNMLISAEATLYAALWRKETRGSHIREDYPHRSDEFLAHSLALSGSDKVSTRPVRVLQEYNKLFDNKTREY